MKTICALLLVLAAGASSAGSPHVHGVANMSLVVEGSQLVVTLESPLDAMVGFERPPRTAKERDALTALGATMNEAAALFLPTAEARCALKSARVNLPFSDDKADKGGHADVSAEYSFQCAHPAGLRGVETTLFKRFSRLYRVEVRRVGPSGQGAGQLTPKKPAIVW